MRRIALALIPVFLTACGSSITGLSISPDTLDLEPEADRSLTVSAEFDDGSTEDVTEMATITSSDEAVVTVDGDRITGVAVGTATITATYEGQTGTATVNVTCEGTNMVNASGTLDIHPVTAIIDSTATLAGSKFQLENPTLALAGRPAVLKHGDCSLATMEVTPDTVDPTTATWSFTAVNTDKIQLGLIGVADDATDAGTTFADTATGLVGGTVTDAQTDLAAFMVTEATEAALAGLAGKNAGELQSVGWVLGMFVDAAGLPIDGVEMVDGNGVAVPNVFYPNADFSGLETDGNTSVNGAFYVTELGLGEYSGKKAGMTFESAQAAGSSGAVFIMFRTGT